MKALRQGEVLQPVLPQVAEPDQRDAFWPEYYVNDEARLLEVEFYDPTSGARVGGADPRRDGAAVGY